MTVHSFKSHTHDLLTEFYQEELVCGNDFIEVILGEDDYAFLFLNFGGEGHGHNTENNSSELHLATNLVRM